MYSLTRFLSLFLTWLVFFNIYTHLFQEAGSKIASPLRYLTLMHYIGQRSRITCHYFNSAKDLSCHIDDIAFVLREEKGTFLYHGIKGEYENGNLHRLSRMTANLSSQGPDAVDPSQGKSFFSEQSLGSFESFFSNIDPHDVKYAEIIPASASSQENGRDLARLETDEQQIYWWGQRQQVEKNSGDSATPASIQSSSFFSTGQLEGTGEMLVNSTTGGKEWTFSFKNIPFRETSIYVPRNESYINEVLQQGRHDVGSVESDDTPNLAVPTISVYANNQLLQFEIVFFHDEMKWFPLPGYYCNATLKQISPNGLIFSWDGYKLRDLSSSSSTRSETQFTEQDTAAATDEQRKETERALERALVAYRKWSLFWKDFLFDSFQMMLKIMKLAPQIERIKYTEGHFVLSNPIVSASKAG